MSIIFNMHIDFIYKAVFFIKAKAQIILYGMDFGYCLQIFKNFFRIKAFSGGQLCWSHIG